MFLRYRKIVIVVIVLSASIFVFTLATRHKPIDFTLQVKPIINKYCITCHGGVRQKGGFSLLFREEALAKTKSGKRAIIPGDAANSEMIKRITLKDPDDRMPYRHDPLSKANIAILRRWINEGAQWGKHWAYVPVTKVEVPSVKSKWVQNEVDNFIEQKLQENDLKPSLRAEKYYL